MTYTANPPTQPGYYWLKTKGEQEIVEIWTDATMEKSLRYIHHCGSGDACDIVSFADALWAGPIPFPD